MIEILQIIVPIGIYWKFWPQIKEVLSKLNDFEVFRFFSYIGECAKYGFEDFKVELDWGFWYLYRILLEKVNYKLKVKNEFVTPETYFDLEVDSNGSYLTHKYTQHSLVIDNYLKVAQNVYSVKDKYFQIYY